MRYIKKKHNLKIIVEVILDSCFIYKILKKESF